ncbi:MAG: hypothetical protein FP820_02850 [Sulfurimonas sp.]|nr:hypothetical protein [Sulfurimonas sp.]MBU1217880.1 hypothetical protein [bacterium]MBU1433321.1 hypothetical protein [bacterium]MBU1504352.1 hypothetical protein [bacterium]MBU3939278.1 hypothetical protein [bacterium]
MQNKKFIRAVLDEDAIICEFECTLGNDCYSSDYAVGKNWFDLMIDTSDYAKVMKVFQSLINGDDKEWETFANDIKCRRGTHMLIDFKNCIEIREGKKYLVTVGTEHYLS